MLNCAKFNGGVGSREFSVSTNQTFKQGLSQPVDASRSCWELGLRAWSEGEKEFLNPDLAQFSQLIINSATPVVWEASFCEGHL